MNTFAGTMAHTTRKTPTLAPPDRHSLADNTIVVFFSDNGGSRDTADNAPLRGGKRDVRGRTQSPLHRALARCHFRRTVSDEFLTSMEIFPTICRAAGASPAKGLVLDGFDMTGVLAGNERSAAPRDVLAAARR